MAAGAPGEAVVRRQLERLVQILEPFLGLAGVDQGVAAQGPHVGRLGAQLQGPVEVVDRVVEAELGDVDLGSGEVGVRGLGQAQGLVGVVQRHVGLALFHIGVGPQAQGDSLVLGDQAAGIEGPGKQPDGFVEIARQQGLAALIAVGDAVGARGRCRGQAGGQGENDDDLVTQANPHPSESQFALQGKLGLAG